jgi:hypothetical protein
LLRGGNIISDKDQPSVCTVLLAADLTRSSRRQLTV